MIRKIAAELIPGLRRLHPGNDVEIRGEHEDNRAGGAALVYSVVKFPEDVPFPTDAELAAACRDVALDSVRADRAPLLVETDMVARQCFKAGTAYPDEWRAFWRALRDVTDQEDPAAALAALAAAKPAFPADI